MKCYHVLSTKPTFSNVREGWTFQEKVNFYKDTLRDFDILTLILSALKWREHNGEIHLITDEVAYETFRQLGILDIWNSCDTEIMKTLPTDINHVTYWASSKIHVLSHLKPPFFIMDMDFIVWDNIEHFYKGKEVVTTHTESLDLMFYPRKELLAHKDYKWDPSYNWSVKPLNTALTYWGNEEVMHDYIKHSFHYMRNSNIDYHHCIPMVFAEQRLLGILLDKHGIEAKTFLTENFQLWDNSKQNYFTHIWGAKNKYRSIAPHEKNDLSTKLVSRITKDYPNMLPILHEITQIKKYY